MRRVRTIREHREKLIRNRVVSKNNNNRPRSINRSTVSSPLKLPKFLSFDNYQYSSRNISVAHVIESVGLGGAQIMMMELVNALNLYYGNNIKNHVLKISKKSESIDSELFSSYKVSVNSVEMDSLSNYCIQNKIDIVVHHRISVSNCIKKYLPISVKYVLVNHTYNSLHKIRHFRQCDIYVSVCRFLDKRYSWPSIIPLSRRVVILNGIENRHIEDLEAKPLEGEFKTGRCHRLVPGKFAADSLTWLETKVIPQIPGFYHYLIGTKKPSIKNCIHSLGTILNRDRKMSVIKSLDLYFYETFSHEGASIAVLESLSCGVPVLCKSFGGNAELIMNGINGFVVSNRDEMLKRMKQLNSDKDLLAKMKKQTQRDFDQRLHVRHAACKYMQVFEGIM